VRLSRTANREDIPDIFSRRQIVFLDTADCRSSTELHCYGHCLMLLLMLDQCIFTYNPHFSKNKKCAIKSKQRKKTIQIDAAEFQRKVIEEEKEVAEHCRLYF
jgi:hypothetical protein